MKKLIALVVGTVATAVLVPLGHAEAATYYGQTFRVVAKHFDPNGGGGTVYKTGVCYLKGRRVNVITVKNVEQQRSWDVFA